MWAVFDGAVWTNSHTQRSLWLSDQWKLRRTFINIATYTTWSSDTPILTLLARDIVVPTLSLYQRKDHHFPPHFPASARTINVKFVWAHLPRIAITSSVSRARHVSHKRLWFRSLDICVTFPTSSHHPLELIENKCINSDWIPHVLFCFYSLQSGAWQSEKVAYWCRRHPKRDVCSR